MQALLATTIFGEPLWIAIAAVGIIGLAAFLQSLVGFGFALLAVPLLVLVIPPKTAVVVVFLLGAIASLLTVRSARGSIDAAEARRLSIGAVLAMPLGVVLLLNASSLVLRLILGVLTIAAALWMLLASDEAKPVGPPRPFVAYGTGAISGVLNTSLSTNGPPLVVYLRTRGLDQATFRSTISVVFSISNAVGLAMLAVGGAIHSDAVRLAVLAVPIDLIGWVLGNAAAKRLAAHHFDRVVDGALLVSGVVVLAKALAG